MDQSQLNIETNTIRIGDNQIRSKTITAVYKKNHGTLKKHMKEFMFLYTRHSAWRIETPKMQTEIDQQT